MRPARTIYREFMLRIWGHEDNDLVRASITKRLPHREKQGSRIRLRSSQARHQQSAGICSAKPHS